MLEDWGYLVVDVYRVKGVLVCCFRVEFGIYVAFMSLFGQSPDFSLTGP